MRKSVENISLLQKQINDLQLENQILKNILERSGISYNRWENICPKMRHEKMNCKDCPYQVYKQLTIKDIRAHLQGRSYSEKNLLLLGTFVLGSFFNKRNVVKLGCSHKVV